ncbi:hypothetical protein GHNINEIG_00400 [Hydrogenovibrio crunogenus]|uniref:Uncharacterized protein n=1 Tax=Hydrogenovibrio crunogenus TaxID=39765 RepID=A0A4P7NX96_9GAMM|nr:hypothetical protein [Hydrogenovibrio crunogenus]QBZ82370.1 hypothetical protein GHNINEIG_00400 [Hydrogenovibrio crunogenus]
MKFEDQKAFPYPVLRPHSDDYLDCEFQVIIDPEVAENRLSIEVDFILSNEEILSEIEMGKAKYVSVVSCRDTFFKEIEITGDKKLKRVFPVDSLRGEVLVESYVVATDTIKNFKSDDLNKEFESVEIDFEKGDLLAQDEPYVLYIDKEYFGHVISVLELVKVDGLDYGEFNINLEGHHIQIELNSEMKDSIDEARNERANKLILTNSIYFTAITYAIENLKSSKEDYKDYKWADVIEKQALNKAISLDSNEDAYKVATQLMKNPLVMLAKYVFKRDS